MRQATEIRAYVDAVRRINGTSDNPMSQESMEEWANWALAQADHIDPVKSGKFLERVDEPEEENSSKKEQRIDAINVNHNEQGLTQNWFQQMNRA